MSKFNVGDKVVVVRRATEEDVWENSWVADMDSMVGTVGFVKSVSGNDVKVSHEFVNDWWIYPSACLEFADKKVEEPSPDKWTDKHYDAIYKLTEKDIERGWIKIDPYRVSKQWRLGSKDESGALFHNKNKYSREIKPSIFVDVYDVLRAFEVVDPCLSHLAKKALCAGLRGHKDRLEDLMDIKASIERAIEMHEEWSNDG